MDESATRWHLPWVSLLTLGLLLLVLLTVLPKTAAAVVPWRALAALAAFCLLRWQQGILWGVSAALLLALQPVYGQNTGCLPQVLRGAALQLVVVAGLTFACRLTFQPTFAWRSWSATTAVLLVAGALAWTAWPHAGMVAGGMTALALVGSAVLALRRPRQEANRPAPANVATAVGVALGVPVAALYLALVVSVPLADAAPAYWTLAPGVEPTEPADGLIPLAVRSDGSGLRGFQAEDLEQWAWPRVWVTVPLTLWGLWCAYRRGWKELARRQPPLAWVLLLFAAVQWVCVVVYRGMAVQTEFVTLATLTVLLAVFGVADVVRGISEALVLLPPQERAG